MAHTYTRIEGFEWGIQTPNFSFIQGTSGTSGWSLTTVSHSGDYALRITPPISSSFILLGHKFNADGTEDSTDYNAAVVRFYFYVNSLPVAGSERVYSMLGAGAERSYITLSSAGVLSLEGTAGTTALAVGNWYRVEVFYENGQSTILRLNGTVEATAAGASSGTVGQSLFGSLLPVTVSYDIFFDDFVAETAAAAASIDYPGPGQILALFPEAEGTDTGGWTATTTIPDSTATDDGDTSLILSPAAGNSPQTVTVQDSTTVGITGTIHAVQLQMAVKRNTTITSVKTRLRQGGNLDESAASSTGTSYNARLKLYTQDLSPADWTPSALDSIEAGIFHDSIAQTRCTALNVQVSFLAAPGASSNSTILDQIALLTGTLDSVTSYDPVVKTVKITSEDIGVDNQAINVVAVSIRHIPYGRGTLKGVWNVDKLDTSSFTINANPLKYSNMDTAGNSSFVFGASTMMDGEQIYTDYVQLGCSGKIFELELTQNGNLCWDILGLEFEIRPDGRRPAYIDGEF